MESLLARRHESFPALLVHLGLNINFSKPDLSLTLHFSLLGLCWDAVEMPVSLPSNKIIEIQ